MDIIKFRPSKDADEKALEEAENKQQDQRLAEEFRATAKELEARALARQPQTELPAEDAQAMLDRMLAQIHADPELHKRAEQLVEVPESTGENGKGSDGKMDREASVPTVYTENDEEADMEELIRLGRALKTAEKHWRTLSERRRHSPRQTKTRGKEGGGEKAPGSSLVLPRLQQWCLSSVSTAMPCVCIG